MSAKTSQQDQYFIKKCIGLSEKALKNKDNPFGALVVKNKKIVAMASNDFRSRVNYHAEILALNKAADILKTTNLSSCILYSNCEPCPMCSFMIREFKIKKVVFALHSPFMGGFSKWKILEDEELAQFKPFFAKPPQIVPGVLESEAKKVFDRTPLWMFGSNARKDRRNKTCLINKKMKGAGILIENSKQEILLFLRDNKKTIPFPNQWDILGGVVEQGESFEYAIKRELMEEVELDLKNFKLFKIYKRPNSTEAIFYTRLDLDISKINLHEGQRLKYFTRKEALAENLAFYGNKIIRDFFKSKGGD